MTTTEPRRIVAEYCPGCGETHYPARTGAAEYCRTCQYYGRDRAAPQEEDELLPEQCDECESTGYNCSLHAGWAEADEAAAQQEENTR